MSVFYEKTYTVDTRDIDPFNCCRPSALLGILQEAATDAAAMLKVTREDVIPKYNVFWMLARIWFRLDRPLRWGEHITVKTWHRGGKGAAMYRDFNLTVDGQSVGEAVSTWVLADVDTHKLFRISNIAEFEGTDGGALCKDKLLSKLRLPADLPQREQRTLYYSDTDINGHVNNSKYADVVCDALHMERLGPAHFVSSLQLGYLAECRPGDTLNLLVGEEEGTYYVRGVGKEDKPRFEGAVTLGENNP